MSSPPVDPPTEVTVRQIAGQLIPIDFGEFDAAVDGVVFTLHHDAAAWDGQVAIGSGTSVSFSVADGREDVDLGNYGFYIVANEGVAGADQVVVKGRWFVDRRGVSP